MKGAKQEISNMESYKRRQMIMRWAVEREISASTPVIRENDRRHFFFTCLEIWKKVKDVEEEHRDKN